MSASLVFPCPVRVHRYVVARPNDYTIPLRPDDWIDLKPGDVCLLLGVTRTNDGEEPIQVGFRILTDGGVICHMFYDSPRVPNRSYTDFFQVLEDK